MVHNIIALVGASGSGKTTISMAMQQAGIPSIVSYTTRPMRPGETNGVEHHFISDSEADSLMQQHPVAAFTDFGGYRYFTLLRQLCYLPDETRPSRVNNIKVATYVIDERGLSELMSNAAAANSKNLRNQYNIIPVYVWRDESIRSQQCDQLRMDRDKARVPFPDAHYLIRIINDAPELSILQSWSYAFAAAMAATFYPLGDSVIYQSILHTSDTSVAAILNKIKNIQMASV